MKEAQEPDILEEATRRFEAIGLGPQLIPRDSISHLRGCLHCINLSGNNIDSALIFQKLSFQENPRYFYRVDYAVRGTLRGVPSQRKIAYTKLSLEGFLRKRLRGVAWRVPEEQAEEPPLIQHEELPPLPGEVWQEGPHQTLISLLNGDQALMEQITSLVLGLGEPYLYLTLSSDNWGESLRLRGSLMVDWPQASRVYTSEAYIRVADSILGHLRGVRGMFGGLTF